MVSTPNQHRVLQTKKMEAEQDIYKCEKLANSTDCLAAPDCCWVKDNNKPACTHIPFLNEITQKVFQKTTTSANFCEMVREIVKFKVDPSANVNECKCKSSDRFVIEISLPLGFIYTFFTK